MTAARTPTPLVVDTGAFFAYYYSKAAQYELARDTFAAIEQGELLYRPLYTTQAVLGELATLLVRKASHADAVRALGEIRSSESFTILPVDRRAFARAAEQFERYDDQQISFVDHTTSVLADARDVEHAFAFDADFATLGMTRVPLDSDDAV